MNDSRNTHRSPAALLQWLTHEIASTLEVAPEKIDVDAEFDEFGLDSVQAVALSGALSEHLAQELPATLLYEHRSIRELADFLGRGEGRP